MSDSTERYDLIIIGSGSGNSIPDYLSDRKIALIERDSQFGGTCLNRGCIPSKMFVLPADVAVSARSAAKLGVDARVDSMRWDDVRERVFGRIDPISAAGREYRASGTANLTLVEGTARFVGHKLLAVGDRTLTADQILIATGARPSIPPIPGLDPAAQDSPDRRSLGWHTSDSIMRLDELPKRLGIVGGGFIACEMAHVFEAFGSRVSMFIRSNHLMRNLDPDVSQRFTDIFGARVDLHPESFPTQVEQVTEANGHPFWRIHTEQSVVEVDELLIATGRRPNSDLLELDATGIETGDDGVIEVDSAMRSNVPGIWAIGDVANRWQLKHVANAEARVAFWNIANAADPNQALRHMDYTAVPAAVFTNPQLADVGLTEPEARAMGRPISVGIRDYASTAYGWALEDHTSFAKVIVDTETREILGAHLMGPQAATLIQPLIQAMQFGQSADEIAQGQLWIHPALTEVVENALLAALADGQ